MPLSTGKREDADVLRELSVLEGSACADCGRLLCGHHALVALVMGFKSAPRCAACLADALDLAYEKFREQVVELVHHRDCYRSGWQWADRREKIPSSRRPACLGPEAAERPAKSRKPLMSTPAPGASSPSGSEWDAGDMGCGDLVLELRLRLGRLSPGAELRLTARDPGAPEDIPAWCRLTGHALVESKHPHYRIRRKES
ncbi:MAG TPA: sulfurtransferase TusA family protein [Planctomycetota bacterium]|nr:sulfurtransferase TusA family protein [Planctomycetota bacterium]